MITKCPFYPDEINPCTLHDCQFHCTGGCAISLAAYAFDVYQQTEDLDKRLANIESGIRGLRDELRRLK